MSYLVLARKYRPGCFKEIIGQQHIVRTVENAIALDRVHHAFLFTGARGVGKTTTARVLARGLNCAEGPTADPCGSCESCVEIAKGNNPDVLEIDGASNTGVDNVRELRENARYLPSKARFKIYIIDEVHMLSKGAFNALLKTLEEPPAHVKFIFATTEPQKIPVTILSRCQRFDFRRVGVQTLVEHLRYILGEEKVTLGGEALLAIVREAQGSVRDALSLLDQVLSYAGSEPDDAQVLEALGVVDRQTVFELCDAVLAQDADALLRVVAAVDSRGHDLSDLASLFVGHLRDLMVVLVSKEIDEAILERSPGEVEALQKQAQGRSRADLHRLFALMVTVAEEIARSAHPRVTLEMGLLRLLEIEPSQGLASLLTRLDGLVSGSTPVQAGPVGRGASAGRSASKASTSAEQVTAPDTEAADDSEPRQKSESNSAWASLLERVKNVRPLLASVLEHARVMKFAPDGVEIGFPANTFYLDSAREQENMDALTKALEQQLGQAVTLKILALDNVKDAPETLADASERDEEERVQGIKDNAVSHPAVKSAQRILGGEIKQVNLAPPK